MGLFKPDDDASKLIDNPKSPWFIWGAAAVIAVGVVVTVLRSIL